MSCILPPEWPYGLTPGVIYQDCAGPKGTCDPQPTQVVLENISNVTFSEDENGVLMRWDEPVGPNYDTHIAVFDVFNSYMIHYEIVPGQDIPNSHYFEINSSGIFTFSYRKVNGDECSEIDYDQYTFLQGITGEAVLHNTVQVTHMGEIVIHTRNQLYLVQDPTLDDYFLTEDGLDFITG